MILQNQISIREFGTDLTNVSYSRPTFKRKKEKNNENINTLNLNMRMTNQMDVDTFTCVTNPKINTEEIHNNNNSQAVMEYLNDIISHLRTNEMENLPKCDYMKHQQEINEKMRAILIDWITDVHLKFKLTPQTLFLTVHIIDKFLEQNMISKSKLQLVGVTSLFISCKYEEIYPPEMKDFVYVTDKAYTKQEILEMENIILKSLQFELTVPSALGFLEMYCEVMHLQDEEKLLLFSRYLLELFLMEYRMLKYHPSLIAASCLYIAGKVQRFCFRSKDIFGACGYTADMLKECARDICLVLDNAEKSKLQAVKKKYTSDSFKKVALWRT